MNLHEFFVGYRLQNKKAVLSQFKLRDEAAVVLV